MTVYRTTLLVCIALILITWAASAAELRGTMYDHDTGSKVWLLEHKGVVFSCWPYVDSDGHVVCKDPEGTLHKFMKVHETEGYIAEAQE
jgi:hypothetical protein